MSAPPWRRMRLSLDRAVPAPVWPDGERPVRFGENRARAMHDTLAASFAGRPDGPASFDGWWSALHRDPEFDPALCVVFADGRGVAQAWTGGFLKDLAVRPEWRRRGLGEALLSHVLALFQARGLQQCELKVVIGNDPATRLYERLGFRPVE